MERKLFFGPVYYLDKSEKTPIRQMPTNIYGPFNNRTGIEERLSQINQDGSIKEIMVFEGELYSVKKDQLKLKQ